jgi:hypothetical protein
MNPRNILLSVCLIVSTACLIAGYGLAGQWIGVVLAILSGLAWLPARKYQALWLPHLCLFASVGLAVSGQLTGASPVLMICGSGLALAVWDLIFLDSALGTNTSEEQTGRYENSHLHSLALALGSGLLAAFLGGWLNLRIPFVVMLLLVALILFGFERIWGTIKRRSAR